MNYKNLKKIEYWGASTAAHQVEGGNHNQWSVWELENASELAAKSSEIYGHIKQVPSEAGNPANYISGKAAQHYNMYEEDFEILQGLNMNAFRFSLEWSRIEPEEGRWDENEIEHYREYLIGLKQRSIEPFVTLWHWTTPIWFAEKGGFEKRANVKYFLRFAEKVQEEFGELIKHVIVLNEPNVYVGRSYNDGMWPPQKTNPVLALWVHQNLLYTHKKAYKLLKKKNKELKVGASNQVAYSYEGNNKLLSKIGAWSERAMWNNWFFDRSVLQTDFIGLNYYFSDRWTGSSRPDNPNEKVNDLGWDMQPANIELVLMELHNRYGKPIVVTENGVADSKDQYRKWWLEETMEAMNRAIENGVEIDGYMHWSLLDNFEWADGFWPRFGLVEVDYETQKRTVRPSAKWFGEQIKQIQEDT